MKTTSGFATVLVAPVQLEKGVVGDESNKTGPNKRRSTTTTWRSELGMKSAGGMAEEEENVPTDAGHENCSPTGMQNSDEDDTAPTGVLHSGIPWNLHFIRRQWMQ